MRHYISTILGTSFVLLLAGCGDTKDDLDEGVQNLSVKTLRIVREKYSYREDVSLDKTVFHEYGKYGLRSEKHDYRSDGSVDVTRFYDYDQRGMLLRDYCDNTYADMRKYTTLSFYDENGQLVNEVGDIDSDGDIDWTRSYTYDAQSKQSSVSVDSNNDGLEDIKIRYTYDINGNIIMEDDGTRVTQYEYSNDAQGRVLMQSRLDVHGVVDRIVTYYWE